MLAIWFGDLFCAAPRGYKTSTALYQSGKTTVSSWHNCSTMYIGVKIYLSSLSDVCLAICGEVLVNRLHFPSVFDNITDYRSSVTTWPWISSVEICTKKRFGDTKFCGNSQFLYPTPHLTKNDQITLIIDASINVCISLHTVRYSYIYMYIT